MKLVSIIVPCCNEEGNIKAFYENTLDVIKDTKYKFEIIFINDGSKDNTLLEMKKVKSKENVNVSIISFSRNFGKESAMYAGLEYSKGEYVIIIDVDMEQNPKLILKMLNKIEENKYDSVAFYQEKRKENIILSTIKNMFYKMINKVSSTDFVSGASDFRLLNRKMVNSILKLSEKNRFSKGIFSWVGFKTCYLPYKVDKRLSGNSKWSFKKLLNYALIGIRSFSSFSLEIVSVIANILILVSFIYLLLFIFNVLKFDLIIFLILLIGGTIIKSISIASKYMYDIYIEVKNRPIYIIDEMITDTKEEK